MIGPMPSQVVSPRLAPSQIEREEEASLLNTVRKWLVSMNFLSIMYFRIHVNSIYGIPHFI